MKNKALLTGVILVSLLLLMALISFFYTPYAFDESLREERLQEPSLAHPFGTDDLGRDIFSRVMVGSRMVFLVGFIAVTIGLIGGVFFGSIAGYFGGVWDELIMHLMDAMMSFPGILIALMVVSVLGSGMFNTMMALGVMAIPNFCRLTRSGFMQTREQTYIQMARSIGVPKWRIMLVHILPNILTSLIVACSIGFAGAILSEAGLSYLGLGIQPPFPSWGRMLKDAQESFLIAPWYALFPGSMICLAVLGFNLLGDGIRDYFDRRNHA